MAGGNQLLFGWKKEEGVSEVVVFGGCFLADKGRLHYLECLAF